MFQIQNLINCASKIEVVLHCSILSHEASLDLMKCQQLAAQTGLSHLPSGFRVGLC